MTSQNGAPGQPNNSNLVQPEPAADDERARRSKQQGLDHIDEFEVSPGEPRGEEQARSG